MVDCQYTDIGSYVLLECRSDNKVDENWFKNGWSKEIDRWDSSKQIKPNKSWKKLKVDVQVVESWKEKYFDSDFKSLRWSHYQHNVNSIIKII